ncbi:MAG: hypothetical protein WA417_22525 [Stellaceae bacterium]|jgi:hypothetical protein
MPRLVALRAVFGQDEANHGTRRYRVGIDGIVRVPPEAAFHLIGRGGFAVVRPPAAAAEMSSPGEAAPGALVRLHHDAAAGCSCGGREYHGNENGDVIVPAAAVAELTAHGFVPPAPNVNSLPQAAERPPRPPNS